MILSHRLVVLAVAVLLAACGPVATPSAEAPQPSTLPTPTPSAAPSIVASPSNAAVAPPCDLDQVKLTPGQSGGAAGTSYLTVFVELVQGQPCSTQWGPLVTIVGAGGATVARSTDNDSSPVLLDYITRYYLAWAGDCGPSPTGSLTAQIELSPSAIVEMPLGGFRPSHCPGENDEQLLSMYADERPGPDD